MHHFYFNRSVLTNSFEILQMAYIQKKKHMFLHVVELDVRPRHDVWAIARTCAASHANQEKGGLRGR